MQDVNVMVVFHSRGEWIERLALAAAVGAVQGRANIRLRCVRDTAVDTEYIAPRVSDAEWADAILVGIPDKSDAAANGLDNYFDSLAALLDHGKSALKIGGSFTEGSGTASLQAAMQRAGLTTVDMISDPDALTAARLQGRRVAEAARVLRSRSGA
jgi:hypothetical protein